MATARRLTGALIALIAAGTLTASPALATSAPRAAHLQIVLPLHADTAGLARMARAVSTPGSSDYRHFQPVALLARRYGASRSARSRVATFLRHAGARGVQMSATGLFATADFTVADAERVFATRLVLRTQAGLGTFITPAQGARAAASDIPRPLRGLVTAVIGLDTRRLASPPTRIASARRLAHAAAFSQAPSGYYPATGTVGGCSAGSKTGGFTPNQYLTAYGYDTLRRQGLQGQGQRVALIEIDGFKSSDLRTFANCFGLRLPGVQTYPLGSRRPLAPGGEATLDLEVLDAAAPGLAGIDVYESAGNAAQVVTAFAAPLVNPGFKPQVLTASLGLCEPDMLASFGGRGIASVESDLDLAAATGITLLASSGDSGSSACTDGNGDPIDDVATNYPATSPYVTAVGGTNLALNAANAIASQPVWNDSSTQPAAGGGGLSDIFTRPGYQDGIVPMNRRAVPDVSMLADIAPGYAIFCTAREQGCDGWTTVGGTSAASPLLAGGMATVDQYLHRYGRELLGPTNPLLYAIGSDANSRAKVFSDVTHLNNDLGPWLPGSGGQALGCCAARPGYDFASGWGSVDLGSFAGVARAVLPKFADVSLGALPRQSPVRSGAITVRLRCSSSCRAGIFGFVDIDGGSSFSLRSGTAGFRRGGMRLVRIPFTAAQEKALRRALAGRRGATAELFGFALDARGRIATLTSARELRIRS